MRDSGGIDLDGGPASRTKGDTDEGETRPSSGRFGLFRVIVVPTGPSATLLNAGVFSAAMADAAVTATGGSAVERPAGGDQDAGANTLPGRNGTMIFESDPN